jgi:integrase
MLPLALSIGPIPAATAPAGATGNRATPLLSGGLHDAGVGTFTDASVPVKVVSERLGHANPAFTPTVYQHVIPGMQEEAASLFSHLIFGGDEAATPAPLTRR